MERREKKGPVGKTLAIVYGAVAAFTAISIVVPIWMEKLERRARGRG